MRHVEQLKVYCPADVSAKWWACFNRLPELNVGITLYIDGRKLPVRYLLQSPASRVSYVQSAPSFLISLSLLSPYL